MHNVVLEGDYVHWTKKGLWKNMLQSILRNISMQVLTWMQRGTHVKTLVKTEYHSFTLCNSGGGEMLGKQFQTLKRQP